MADIEAAKNEIEQARASAQKATGLLTNRFGHESDVFANLSNVFARLDAAVRHLADKKGVVAAGGIPATVAAAAPASTESAGTAPAELTTDIEPSTETTSSRRKR